MFYLNDSATSQDALDFAAFRAALREIVTTAQTPLTVGVFGPWGSGKTSLMLMLRDDIEAKGLPFLRTAWFTAWKYDRQDALWRALILRVLDALYPRGPGSGPREEHPVLVAEPGSREEKLIQLLQRLEESVYQAVEWEETGPRAINWWQFLGSVGKASLETAATLGTVGLFPQLAKLTGGDVLPGDDIKRAAQAISREARQYHRRQLAHMEQFEAAFKEAVGLAAPGGEGRLIVFVDDLDRCLPEKAVEVLEAIKLFLATSGVVFVLGMDKEVVRRGIEARYGAQFHQVPGNQKEPISGEDYLQKLVQIPFHLPVLAEDDLEEFVAGKAAWMSEPTRQVIAHGVFPNPRQVKRILNIFLLLRTIADKRFGPESDQIADPLLAKTVLIQVQYPDLYQLWRQYPVVVQMLEEAYDRERISEEEMLTGRRRAQPEAGTPASTEALAAAAPGKPAPREGLLAVYLDDRTKYARLARMLTYPPAAEAGDGRARARFAGLNKPQLEAYVRLAGAVESRTPPPTVGVLPADLLAAMLSGEPVRIHDAASALDSEEPDRNGPKHGAVRAHLVQIVADGGRTATERVSAGDALALVGDPRPGVGVVVRDGLKLPDIAWGEEVPADVYPIGGDPDAYWSFDRREATIERPYRLARYPVTYAQFQCFLEAPDFNHADWWEGIPDDEQQFSEQAFPYWNHPRERVSWYQAVAFCRWLGQHLGGEIDLPHEFEWEVAARYPDNRPYPWGNGFDPERANTGEGGVGQTTAVGLYPRGANQVLGLYDLSGNVWEWCRNRYRRPDEAWLDRDPVDSTGDARTLRGGSWRNLQGSARAAYRDYVDPFSRDFIIGLRLVVRRPPSP